MSTAWIRPTLRDLKFSPTLLINEEVAQYRQRGDTVYHMGFGESPFPVHPAIQEGLSDFSGRNRYLPAAGLAELRLAAGEHIRRKHGIDSGDFDVMIGPGSKELIFDVQLAVDGDLLFPAPSWVSYIPQTLITRDRVVRIQLGPEQAYKLDADRLGHRIQEARGAGYRPTKLILNYPNNPTGMTYSADELAALAEVCRREQILVISDEIYAQVSFGTGHRSIADYYPEGTIVTSGLSKHLSLGGFRLGVALVPRSLDGVFRVLRSIASETFSSVSTPIQYTVLRAFQDDPDIDSYIGECTRIHAMVTRYVWRTLDTLGVSYGEPEGGFYLYPDFSEYRSYLEKGCGVESSDELAHHLLHSMSVATLPGSAFGDDPEALRLRLSTVDFDGVGALAAYRSAGPDIDEPAFVETSCPRVAEGCRRLEAYFHGGDA